jgi:hypothetical protein
MLKQINDEQMYFNWFYLKITGNLVANMASKFAYDS